jgi:hypothetical protein
MNTKGRDFATFWQSLEAILTVEPTTNTIFNQYRDSNDQVDVQDEKKQWRVPGTVYKIQWN